jgi:hypothetical protein
MVIAHVVTLLAACGVASAREPNHVSRARIVQAYAYGVLVGAFLLQLSNGGATALFRVMSLRDKLESAAGSQSLALVVVAGFFLSLRHPLFVHRARATSALLLVGCIVTGSRTALLVILTFALATVTRTQLGVAFVSLLFAAATLGVLVAPRELARVAGASRYVSSTVSAGGATTHGTLGFRLVTYRLAVREIRARPPAAQLSGEGTEMIRRLQREHGLAGQLKAESNLGRILHNDVLTFAAVYGIPVAALLVWLLAQACVRARDDLSVFFVAVSVVVFALDDNVLAIGLSLGLPAVVVGLGCVAPRLSRRGAQESVPALEAA